MTFARRNDARANESIDDDDDWSTLFDVAFASFDNDDDDKEVGDVDETVLSQVKTTLFEMQCCNVEKKVKN